MDSDGHSWTPQICLCDLASRLLFSAGSPFKQRNAHSWCPTSRDHQVLVEQNFIFTSYPLTAGMSVVYLLLGFQPFSSFRPHLVPHRPLHPRMFSRALFLCSLVACFSFTVASPKNPKRGIGYAGDVPGDIINANQTDSVITWLYNWADTPPDYIATSNISYIPMQWGSVNINKFPDAVKAQGAKTILTFNEPDYVKEANMAPDEAAKLWMQYIEPLKTSGIRLGGPAITAAGRDWLNKFIQACTDCTIDFLPLHWYGLGLEGFYGYIWDVHSQYPQYPIWITEYAETSPNDAVVFDFMNQTITYLDTLDWIERYAWFGYMRPRLDVHYNLLRADGGLNALGMLYLNASTVHTQTITSSKSASQPLAPIMGSQSLLATVTLISCFFGALWSF